MELIHTISSIYAALWLGCIVIFAGAQNMPVPIYNKSILRGEDVTLYCDFPRNLELLNCRWYFTQNGTAELANGTRYTWSCSPLSINWLRTQISFKNATITDSGKYTCEVTTASEPVSRQFLLSIHDKPTVRVNEFNYSIGMEDNLTLHCSIDGDDSAVKSVQWLKEDNFRSTILPSSMRIFWDISSPSLKINIVRLDDAGKYTCMLTTAFGTTFSQPISVQVFSKPSIVIPVYEYQPINGTTVALKVRIDVRMQTLLSVRWEKYNEDSQQWFPLENNSRLFWTYAEPSLKIATALVEDDGKYRIIGRTAYHEVTSSPIRLFIYLPVKIKKLETKPVVIREGDKVEIRCLVDGRPEPRVKWMLANGTAIVPSSLENVQGNILILENVTNLNEGNYTCIAQNNFSSDKSLISLTVSDLPVIRHQDKEDLAGSSLEKYVVPGVSVVACMALIALIVVVILIRRKRLKGRTDKPNSGIRSTIGQQLSSPSEYIRSDMTYAQVVRKSNKNIDGNKSTGDTNISQSNTHIDGSNSTRDTDTSQVYMNINNTYTTVQQRSSTSNSRSYIHEETESENTQVKRTEELNYTELEFSSNAQDENSGLIIRGSPSDTTYTEVVVFTR